MIGGVVLGGIYLNLKQNKSEQVMEPEITGPVTTLIGEARSLDGSMTLELKRTFDSGSGMQTYSYIVSGSPTPIFTKTVGTRNSMSIPVNSWSPENKYVFIEEINEQGEKNYLVLKADGEPIIRDQQYFDVRELFAAKKTKYILDEVTGWASPTLLILTTKKDEDTSGLSYWLEIPSKAILQLSR